MPEWILPATNSSLVLIIVPEELAGVASDAESLVHPNSKRFPWKTDGSLVLKPDCQF